MMLSHLAILYYVTRDGLLTSLHIIRDTVNRESFTGLNFRSFSEKRKKFFYESFALSIVRI